MKNVFSPFQFVLIALSGWMNHRQYQLLDYLREENRVLRAQLGKRRLRFNDDQRRRSAVRAKLLGQRLKQETPIVTCETLLTWHRKLIPQKYDGSRRRSRGRPCTVAEIEALVVRMARENRDWGYSRIEGALSNLRHKLGRSTIAAILKRHGIEPPERIKKTTWKEFLAQHGELLVAADFFTVEVWTRKDLERFLALFFLELSTRKVEIAGITCVGKRLVDGPGSQTSNGSGRWFSQR